MRGVIYRAESENCSVSFPIMLIVNNQYVLCGPEFKKGIQACISYEDYLKVKSTWVAQDDSFFGGTNKYATSDIFVDSAINDDISRGCSSSDGTPGAITSRCIDMWEALKDNFYFMDVDEPLKFIMYLYFWLAENTNNLLMVPDPISPLMTFSKMNISTIYVAKEVGIDRSKVDLSMSRDVYFSTLAGDPCKIVTNKNFSSACLVSNYIPNMIYRVGIIDFDKTLISLIKNIEYYAQNHGFIHGKTHIGHVSQSGKLIDFGESFGFREPQLLDIYLRKMLPSHLVTKACEKAKIQNVDMTAACTLLEIYRFIDSIHNSKQHGFTRYYDKIIRMKTWIIDTLTEYLNADESIFTMLAHSIISFEGAGELKFGLPPMYTPIKEKFPTYYFMKQFYP